MAPPLKELSSGSLRQCYGLATQITVREDYLVSADASKMLL